MKGYTEEDLKKAYEQGAKDYHRSSKTLTEFLKYDINEYIDIINTPIEENLQYLTQYQSFTSNLFFSFLHGDISAEKVKTELKTLEKYHQDLTQTKKELWFRFENVVFSIDEVYKDLKQQKDFLLEQIENSLKLGNDLEIYYS